MSTNYRNTFIAVAPDCSAAAGEKPPSTTGQPTVASLQYEMLAEHPYVFTSDEVMFAVHARRAGLTTDQLDEERERFFARDQACLRASPLSKRYGWGTHHDEQGRVALIGAETEEYARLAGAEGLVQKYAMRSSRASSAP